MPGGRYFQYRLGNRGDLRGGRADVDVWLEKILTTAMPASDYDSTCSISLTELLSWRS